MPTPSIAGDPRFAVTGDGSGEPRNSTDKTGNDEAVVFVLPDRSHASEIKIRLSNGTEFGTTAKFVAGAIGDLMKSEADAACLRSRRQSVFRKIRQAARLR